MRAAHGWICYEERVFVPLSSILEQAGDETAFQCNLLAKKGNKELHEKYGQMAAMRREIEHQLLEEYNSQHALVKVEIYNDLFEDTYSQHEVVSPGLNRAI